MRVYEATWSEVAEHLKHVDIAILPTGSIEQHSLHLPLSTDSYDAEWVASRVYERLSEPKPLLLPPLHYGMSLHHMGFPGTVSLRPETLEAVLYDICISLVHHGVRKVVIINGHGGNRAAISSAAARVKWRTNALVVWVDNAGRDARMKLVRTPGDIHAGEYETSTSLANRPEAVRTGRIRRPDIRPYSPALGFDSIAGFQFRTDEVTDTGAIGDPTLADPEKGKALWDATIEDIVRVVESLRDVRVDIVWREW